MTSFDARNSSLASLPLLDGQKVEQAQLELSKLAYASAALKQGKMPTSDQLANITQKILKSDLLQPELGSRFAGRVGGGKLSNKGKDLVTKLRAVLESVLRLGLEKNDDNKIQRFIYACSQAAVDIDGQIETPDVPLPSSQEIRDARDALRQLLTALVSSSQLRGLLAESVNLARDLFADAADQVAQAAIQTTKASQKASKAARPSEEERAEGKTGLEGKELPNAKKLKKQTLRQLEDAKDDAEDQIRRRVRSAKSYVDEAMPEDARDAVIEKFKQIVGEIQEDPQYEDSINTLGGLIKKYASLATEAVKDAAEKSTAGVDNNKEAEDATILFRQIVESFTGPLDDVFRTGDAVVKDLQNDERIQSIFEDAQKMLDRAISDPGWVTSSRAQRQGERLYDRAQELVQSNPAWKKNFDAFTSALSAALDTASHDKALQDLSRRVELFSLSAKRFAKSSINLVDGDGIWGDITGVFLPRVLQMLKSVPLPRIEYTSEDVDLVIDGLRLESASFMPDALHFNSGVDLRVNRGYAAYASTTKARSTISIHGLRLAAKDISYYVLKKSGWVGLEDAGLLDVFIGSQSAGATDGLDITLTVENAKEQDRETFFVLKKVDIDVEGFDIRVHGSQHPIRNWLARPALRTFVEKQTIAALEEQVAVAFKSFDKELYAFQQRSLGAGRAAADPLAFIQAVLMPHGGSGKGVKVKDAGITKVGPRGEYILAIGVDETLLPGRLTGLGRKGKDVVHRKRTAENLMEEGRAAYEDVREQAREIGEELSEEAERVRDEMRVQEQEEGRRDGWKSNAFDM